MKKVTLILVSVILIGLTSAFAQKPFIGTIKSKMSVEGTTDPNILSQIPENTTVTIYENNTKSVMELMPGVMTMTTITRGDLKKTYVIFEITGMGKYYIENTEEDLAKEKGNTETKFNRTGEKKTIAGYECEKVIITVTDKETDEEVNLVAYMSKAINPSASINFGSQYEGLEGYPLRTEVKTEMNGTEVTMITEAYEITPSKKIKTAEFLLPADGQKTTMKEFMKMIGAGGDDEDED